MSYDTVRRFWYSKMPQKSNFPSSLYSKTAYFEDLSRKRWVMFKVAKKASNENMICQYRLLGPLF